MLEPSKLSTKALNFKGLNLKSLEDTVLATIINAKVLDVENIDTSGQRTAPHYSLEQALKNDGKRHFILECKKSSPSLGDFCKDFDLDKLISCYEDKASAISVLCEEHFFKGDLKYLSYVKERCSLPVICKDFIICEEQIKAASIAGADAVLLMLSVLTQERYLELYHYAKNLNLDVLTEIDDEKDALFTIENNIKIVGINNRNLRTLVIDLNNAKKLYPLFPKDVAVVSESGIKKHQDLVDLNPIKNFLIGSSLTIEQDVNFKANSMLYGLNKVCGMKTVEGLQALVKNHVAIAGLIFAKKSPRFIDDDKALNLVQEFKDKIRFAGVFLNATNEEMIAKAKLLSLSYLQLHGTESQEQIIELKKALPNVQIIKALNIKTSDDLASYKDYLDVCDLLLLDSNEPGSGTSFDWDAIDNLVDKEKTLLSGGIGLDNLDRALAKGYLGLDLNSKLEKAPGIKDVNLINQAFNKINNY